MMLILLITSNLKVTTSLILHQVLKNQMNSKKKILFINNGIVGGGIERVSSSLANYFSDIEYKVQVLALYQDDVVFKLNNSI